jgi:hypothetical protein
MTVNVMNQEDRTERGGDHIPFRQRGYTSIRFCSANEHGDAGVSDTNYTDRQHTTNDILGIDTDLDGDIDSFFVDFNYLKRNTILNALTATMVSEGPEIPEFMVTNDANGLTLTITGQTQYSSYRVGVRPSDSLTAFENVYTMSDTLSYTIPGIIAGKTYFISVASVSSKGIMSIFSSETLVTGITASTLPATGTVFSNVLACSTVSGEGEIAPPLPAISIQCEPNPAQGETLIKINLGSTAKYKQAYLVVTDVHGREVDRVKVNLKGGQNEIPYSINGNLTGVYMVNLFLNAAYAACGKLVVINK